MNNQLAIIYDYSAADSPHMFILLVQDYLRRKMDICENCKMRCASAVIESISDVWAYYWNTLPPELRPQPSREGPKAKLERLGITEGNRYGLDLPEAELESKMHPDTRLLMLDPDIRSLTTNIWAAHATRTALHHTTRSTNEQPIALGERISIACNGYAGLEELPNLDIAQFITSHASALGRLALAQPPGCVCTPLNILHSQSLDLLSPYRWAEIVLELASTYLHPAIIAAWRGTEEGSDILAHGDVLATRWAALHPGHAPHTSFAAGDPAQADRLRWDALKILLDCDLVPSWEEAWRSGRLTGLVVEGRRQRSERLSRVRLEAERAKRARNLLALPPPRVF
ncbi:hypothetical protein B0T25DRAFT_366025 [Lasiosphaeria hispida]|uniref:Uncharacterized protein n=1 Tax=Lasiosphaeria hispida TaxID=260671 RepID=A0AAJ0H5G3_9PEZI|nr:hypothetical protein B0T25DRAFT_366025 [Lasiosphaeria hispida]